MADLNLDLTGARATATGGPALSDINLALTGARADALAGILGEAETNFFRWQEFFNETAQQVICNLSIPPSEPTVISLPRMVCRGSIVNSPTVGALYGRIYITNDTVTDSASADAAFWILVQDDAGGDVSTTNLTSPVAAIKVECVDDVTNISLRIQPLRNFRGN